MTQGGVNQRSRILDLALKLMAERGAEGMSMRDLAAAAEVNVATIYHYFPSKRDLLTAILESHGYLDSLAGSSPVPDGSDQTQALVAILDDSWQAMLAVEDYIRLMLGEALRSDSAAQSIGEELLLGVESALERWLKEALPNLSPSGAAPLARMLRSVIIGVFIEHLAGTSDDPAQSFRDRAAEVAETLTLPGTGSAEGSGA